MSYALVGDFIVTGARNRGNKPNPHGGELTKWYVDLEDEQGQPVKNESGEVADAYWQRKAGSEVTVGDKVYGKVEEGEHGLRFKLEQRPDGAPREVSSGSSGSKGWEPESSRDPEKTARIGRAHAQHMSILTLTAMGAFDGKSAPMLQEKIKDWTSYFEQDVNEAGQASSQAQDRHASQEGAAPPPAASPGPDSVPADHQWLCKLLEDVALDSTGAHAIAGFITAKFSPEQVKRAETGLQNLETQADTLQRLRVAYEKSEGEPVPVPSDDEDIPF